MVIKRYSNYIIYLSIEGTRLVLHYEISQLLASKMSDHQFDIYFSKLWCKKSQTDDQFGLHQNLCRLRAECRECPPGRGGRLVCNNHQDQENIARTYLVDYKVINTENQSLIVKQVTKTAILCPVSSNCNQVRTTIKIDRFVFLGLHGKFFFYAMGNVKNVP